MESEDADDMLPRDCDGRPIRLGDTVEDTYAAKHERMTVVGMRLGMGGNALIDTSHAVGGRMVTYKPSMLRVRKRPSVEVILHMAIEDALRADREDGYVFSAETLHRIEERYMEKIARAVGDG